MVSFYLSLILIEIINVLPVECDLDCLIDTGKGFDDPKNIYQCKNNENCCIEFARPSCCRSKPALQILGEQLSIWGTLFGILLMISTIVYCRKKDLHFAKYLKRCLISCCCGQTDNRQNEDNGETQTKPIVTANEVDSRV